MEFGTSLSASDNKKPHPPRITIVWSLHLKIKHCIKTLELKVMTTGQNLISRGLIVIG